jgi:hypothetical protein
LEIILVLGGIPLAVMFLLALLTLRPNFRRAPTYRPGDEWNHPPVWWVASASLNHQQAPHQHESAADTVHGGARGDW